MSKKIIPTSDVTVDVINGWKAEFGKVTKYTTKDGKELYFRSPDRKEISAARTVAQEKDGITSNQVLAKATALGGDVEILDQDKYLIGLGAHLNKVIDTVEGELEEL